jgi:drug/metabolite transporter (DMT)-like permease
MICAATSVTIRRRRGLKGMVAILGGLGAAVAFASSTVCSSRSSRLIGAGPALAWVALVGLMITLPAAMLAARPDLGAATVAWLGLAGAGNAAGLLLTYLALRSGKVGIVAPIVSAEGAIAALIAAAAGQPLPAATAAVLAVIAAGVLLAGTAREEAETAARRARPALLAVAAAVSFGLSLYATARIGRTLPIVWAVLPARLVGVVAVAAPLALTRRMRLTRPALPLVLAAGLAEVLGFTLYALGARHDVAISAVLASLFGAFAAVVARVVFAERLAALQLLGVATTIAGVAALSVLQA